VSPILVTIDTTTEEKRLREGDRVYITGVLGNTNANGSHIIRNVEGNTFTLFRTKGNGNYMG
jgi:hypothetical protein